MQAYKESHPDLDFSANTRKKGSAVVKSKLNGESNKKSSSKTNFKPKSKLKKDKCDDNSSDMAADEGNSDLDEGGDEPPAVTPIRTNTKRSAAIAAGKNIIKSLQGESVFTTKQRKMRETKRRMITTMSRKHSKKMTMR